MRRLAMRSALSVKVAEDNLVLIDSFEKLEPKTKAMIQALQALNVGTERVLMLVPQRSELIDRAAGNLPGVKPLVAQYVNMHDMFKYQKVIMPLASLDILNGFLSQAAQRHNGKKFAGTDATESSSDTSDIAPVARSQATTGCNHFGNRPTRPRLPQLRQSVRCLKHRLI